MTNKVIYSKTILASALAISGAAFTACSSETDIVTDSKAAAKEIGFSAYVNKNASRAEITNTNITDNKINVYGYITKDSGASYTSVYGTGGATITYADGKWKCGTTALWDDNGKYNFFGIAPITGTVAKDAATMSIEDVPVIETVDKGNDIIVASKKDVTGPKTETEGNVPLDFSHALAKLTVKAYTSIPASEGTITLKNLKLLTPKMTNGVSYTFDVAEDRSADKVDWTGYTEEDDAAVNTAMAATDASTITTTLNKHKATELYKDKFNLIEGENWATAADNDYFLAPAAVGTATTYYLVATYGVKDDTTDYTKVVKVDALSTAAADAAGKILPGYHYTLYVDICPNVIKPYVNALNGWTDKVMSGDDEVITIPSK